jgi:hypothetical protein
MLFYGFICLFCVRTQNDFDALCKESVLKLLWPDSEQDLDLKMGFWEIMSK